ncbi:MAG: hypothetical protein EOM35_09075 [Negativicutes bacterium]|nr:hypothetical protein [Negativicutes bacterium]
MLRLVKFDNQTTYMFPNGDIATPDIIIQQFPAITHFTHVLEVNGDVCQAVMNLKALRGIHNIDESITEDEAIAALEVIINTPPPEPVVSDEPTAEERIAASLEYQNLMMM